MKTIFVNLCCMLGVAAAMAELPPGTYTALKKEATAVLQVEITSAESPEPAQPVKRYTHRSVTYEAKILKVFRTKAAIKPGDTIRIASYYLVKPEVKPVTDPDATPEELAGYLEATTPIIGPPAPKQLQTGWTGKVYLKPGKSKDEYAPAAYGQSFE
jgi:hypothetical protein